MWIGNEGDEELCLQAGELAGFNLGQYEEKVVAGPLVDILLGMVYWIIHETSELLDCWI